MTRYIAAADCGTTGAKAVIYDLTGEPIGEGYQEYGLSYPRPGWVEQDPDMLREACVRVIKEAVQAAGVDPAQIISLCFSTQRCTLVPVDADGNSLRAAISWQDNRTDQQCEEIRVKIGADRFYDETGLPVANVWTLPKIMWLRDNDPDVFRKASKFVNIQAYLNKALGADDFYDDFSNASLHGLMSLGRREWIEEFAQALGIPSEKLPTLVGCGVRIGELSESAADETGLLPGTPIVSGGGDQQCAAVGCNVLRDGDCEVTLGTAGVTICSLDAPYLDPDRVIPCLVHAANGKYTCEGLQNAAGASLKWLRNILQQAHPSTQIDYDFMVDLAKGSELDARGLIFLPYLAGAAAPMWDGSARGTLVGMSLQTDLGDVVRAVLEGVSLETAWVFESFKKRGIRIDNVKLSGGGAKSELWAQLQADIYGIAVERLKVDDATILGAAILGALGVGAFETIEDAAAAMVHTVRQYEPQSARTDQYQKRLQSFKSLYLTLREFQATSVEGA